jgi:hypothetical protein
LHIGDDVQPQALDRISVPRLYDPPSLALGPVEAFVLSKVDGRRSISDLAVIVGLSQAEVEAVLHRLSVMGAIIIDVLTSDAAASDYDSSRPTMPGADDPFESFDRTTSPGEPPDELLRAAGASMRRRTES